MIVILYKLVQGYCVSDLSKILTTLYTLINISALFAMRLHKNQNILFRHIPLLA